MKVNRSNLILLTLLKLAATQETCRIDALVSLKEPSLTRSSDDLTSATAALHSASQEKKVNCKQLLIELYKLYPNNSDIFKWITDVDREIEISISQFNESDFETKFRLFCLRLCGNTDCKVDPETYAVNPPDGPVTSAMLDFRKHLGVQISNQDPNSERLSDMAESILKALHHVDHTIEQYDDCFKLGRSSLEISCPIMMPFKKNRYKLVRFLGAGADAVTLKAIDKRTNRAVAIKISYDEPKLDEFQLDEIARLLRSYKDKLPSLAECLDQFYVQRNEGYLTSWLVTEFIRI